MFTEITDLPAGVIGFEVAGKLAAEDYRDTLDPALKAAAETGEIRLVLVMPEFEGMQAGAVWEDTKAGFSHWQAWKRIAVVTDIEWMSHAIQWLGWMSPGQVKTFPIADRAAAIEWAAAS
jgi:hypothetical protein